MRLDAQLTAVAAPEPAAVLTGDPAVDLLRPVGVVVGEQPGRGLRDHDQGAEQYDDRRDRADREHPAPALDAGERQVDQVGDHDPDRDHQLVEGEAADLRRCELTQVGGDQRGGAADREAEHHAADQQHDVIGGEDRDGGADQEDHSDHSQHLATSERVGHPALTECTDHRTQQQQTHDRALRGGGEVEVGLDEQQCAGDHAGVVAEQEPADGDHRSPRPRSCAFPCQSARPVRRPPAAQCPAGRMNAPRVTPHAFSAPTNRSGVIGRSRTRTPVAW